MSKRKNPIRSIIPYQGQPDTGSWLTLQAITFFIACIICSCCSLSSYAWGSLSPRITIPAPSPSPRPTQTVTPTLAATGSETRESPTPVIAPTASPTPISTRRFSATIPSNLATPTLIPSPTMQATPAITQTQAPEPTDTGRSTPSETSSDLHIIHVEYNPAGLENPDPEAEIQKEHVVIENRGAVDQDMSGWTLNNNRLDIYQFPANFILRSRAIVQIWTKNGVDSSVILYWESEEELWDNETGVVFLRDHEETLVDTFSW